MGQDLHVSPVKAKFKAFAQTLGFDSPSVSLLRSGLDELKMSSSNLTLAVQENLDLFEHFLNQCNRMMPSKGLQQEYLLDVCSQRNDACIEKDGVAQHVGCCCGVNPVVASTTKINGLNSSVFEGGEVDLNIRRLQQESNIDICGEARGLVERNCANKISMFTKKVFWDGIMWKNL